MASDSDMATTSEYTSLELIKTDPPVFKSLGRQRISYFIPKSSNKQQYVQSDLFPIGTEVELTSGKFPIHEYKGLLDKKEYVIGGKNVRIIAVSSKGAEDGCSTPHECTIEVKEHQSNGGSRRRARRSSRRRSTRRRSSRRRSTRRRSTRRRF